jgi:hypothetical protein
MDPLLLRDDPLSGAVGVQRWLTAERSVHLVDPSSFSDAVAAVEAACNIWGGAYHLLVPVPDGSETIPEPWRTLVSDTDPGRTFARGRLPVPPFGERPNVGGDWREDSFGYTPLAVLGRVRTPPEGYRTVRIANDFDPDDPWTMAYTAVWGRLPPELDREQLQQAGLPEDITYSDVIPIDPAAPPEPGAADLLASLRGPDFNTATRASCVRLACASARLGLPFEGVPPSFPLRFDRARECGPNLVVVYEPCNVTDLCLLWHLRAVHGLRPGLPLAVPATADVPAALAHWWQEDAQLSWGLRSTKGHLVSTSVGLDDLTRFAEQSGEQWSAAPWQDVLQPSRGCGISSTEVAVFESGRAELSDLHPSEEAVLGREIIADLRPSPLELVVTPVRSTLPPSRTLARAGFGPRYRGGAVLLVGGLRDTVDVVWPTGLTVLDAVIRDRGLRGQPSEPGRLAETLLRRAEGLGGMGPVKHPGVHELLARLGERHGMSWFKRRLRAVLDIPADADASVVARIEQVEENVRVMAGEPSDEEQADITFEDVRRVFRNNAAAAEAWLAWADGAGLVLRGARVQCGYCASRSWRPLPELAPPVVCRGCGRAIDRPYGYDTVKFRYRASEFLLQLLKADAVVHALALRFISDLFPSSFVRIGPLFGGYPGVTLRRPGENDPLGEADVLFVMIDGRVGVGECKTRAAGLIEEEVEKLRALAEAVDASWTFTATLDRSSACGPLWRSSPTGGRIPHFALTAEHLLDVTPRNVLGTEPMAWRDSYLKPDGAEPQSDDEHDAEVVKLLHGLDSWYRTRDIPWWRAEE